ncbi:MAG: Dyp-type peroxidase [Acidihalobacter sp.]|jgi:porphyrinogen peroxidase
MNNEQTGILSPLPAHARYLSFELAEPETARDCLRALRDIVDGERVVVGIGESLALALGSGIPGLKTLPARAGEGFDVPSTPAALWCWLRGEDRGALFHLGSRIEDSLAEAFRLVHAIDAFKYQEGLDLSGFEDGTENPEGDAARAAALAGADGDVPSNSSFVAVQVWEHDFDQLQTYSPEEQDDMVGRRRSDNEELDDAPASAHVKRTAQESFEPEAFMLRRSMPWTDGNQGGLVFVAFGRSLYAFEAAMNRMAGVDDGITDALFRFTRPRTGAYFWCPPMRGGRLDLQALGI